MIFVKKRFLLVLLPSLLLFACRESVQFPLKAFDGFDDGMRKNGDGLAVEAFFAVPLQSGAQCMVEGIKKIIPVDSLLIVVSERSVLAFDRCGHYICNFGQRGNGEGEYIKVSTAYWDKSTRTLRVIDGIRNRALVYAQNGKLLDTLFFPPATFSLLGTAESLGRHRLFCANYIYNDQNVVMSDFDMSKEEGEPVYRFPGQTDNTQEYTGRHPFALSGNEIACVLPFDNRIYVYSTEDMSLLPRMEVLTRQPVLAEEQLVEIEDYGINRYAEELSRGVFVGFTDIFETSGHYLLGFSNLYYAVADKVAGRVERYGYGVDKENVDCLPLVNILSTDNDGYLIGYENAFDLKSWRFADSIQDRHLRVMERAVSTMAEEDNPCLFFYKLKRRFHL